MSGPKTTPTPPVPSASSCSVPINDDDLGGTLARCDLAKRAAPLPATRYVPPARTSTQVIQGRNAGSRPVSRAERDLHLIRNLEGRAQQLGRRNPNSPEAAEAYRRAIYGWQKGAENHTHTAFRAPEGSRLAKILASTDPKDHVKRLQAAVSALGYRNILGTYGIDGKKGLFTDSAVETVRKAYGLKETGAALESKIIALALRNIGGASHA